MLGGAEHLHVGIVVKEGRLRPPAHPHGMTGVEHQAGRRLQALRPALDRAERRARPIEAADPSAQLATIVESSGNRRNRVGHAALWNFPACYRGNIYGRRGASSPGITKTMQPSVARIVMTAT